MSPRFQKGDRLPHDFFKCPALTVEQKKKLLVVSSHACEELVKISEAGDQDEIKWVPINDDSNAVQLFQAIESNERGVPLKFYKGKSRVKGSIEEVSSLFSQKNTSQLRKSTSKMQKDIIDSVILYQLVGPTTEYPRDFIGIKWTAMQSPVSIVSSRDFCFVECCQDFTDKHGRRGWAIAKQSIKLTCCPSLEKSHGLIRGSIYRTGFVFTETSEPGVMEVMNAMQFDFKGSVPKWVEAKACKKRLNSIVCLDQYLQRKRLSKVTFKGDLELVPKKSRNLCHLCNGKFSLLNRKCRCRKCGEVVCMKCNKQWKIDLPTIGMKKLRICTVCSVKVRENDFTFNSSSDASDSVCSFPSQSSGNQFKINSSINSTVSSRESVDSFASHEALYNHKELLSKEINGATTSLSSKSGKSFRHHVNGDAQNAGYQGVHQQFSPPSHFPRDAKKKHKSFLGRDSCQTSASTSTADSDSFESVGASICVNNDNANLSNHVYELPLQNEYGSYTAINTNKQLHTDSQYRALISGDMVGDYISTSSGSQRSFDEREFTEDVVSFSGPTNQYNFLEETGNAEGPIENMVLQNLKSMHMNNDNDRQWFQNDESAASFNYQQFNDNIYLFDKKKREVEI